MQLTAVVSGVEWRCELAARLVARGAGNVAWRHLANDDKLRSRRSRRFTRFAAIVHTLYCVGTVSLPACSVCASSDRPTHWRLRRHQRSDALALGLCIGRLAAICVSTV